MPSKNALFYRGVVRFSILLDAAARYRIATTILSGVSLISKTCNFWARTRFQSQPRTGMGTLLWLLLVHAGCRFAGRITNALACKQISVTLEQVVTEESKDERYY